MPLSLPTDRPGARSLADVLPEIVAALQGASDVLPPARAAVLFVVDGLGAHNLSARSGHARFLTQTGGRRDVARTVFPSTTAAALTSLLTGTAPGVHGVVGYRVRVPHTGRVVNQLKGWDDGTLDPLTWQRATPVFTEQAAQGRPCFVVSKRAFEHSGLTEATLRGAELHSADTAAERIAIACDLAAAHPGALIYVYTPLLDSAGHKFGWESEEWSARLEQVDAAARALSEGLPQGAGALITADHGMVDVPPHRHVLLDDASPLLRDVAALGGEPRMLHVYAHPGCAADVLARWRDSENGRAWVLSRDDAIDAGLFGDVAEPVRERIGDVLVAARGMVAYYDDRATDKRPQAMIGQHGSLTAEERIVPFLRLGVFA